MTSRLKPLLFAIALLLAPLAVPAAEEHPSTRESPSPVWRSERNFEAVQEAWELVANEQYAEAETRFRELVARIDDDYERSQAMFGLAQALMSREQFDEALRLYEQIVDLDVLPNRPHFDAMFQLAQLYYLRERFDDALRWLDRWKRESGETKVQYFELRASIYAQQERYRPAIENIDQAIAMTDEPKQTWYQLKLAMHYELEEFRACKDVLEILIRNWPDRKMYWSQLASINVTLKDDREALAVLALAKRQGMLDKETDWMQLFSLYGLMDVPFKAAQTLAEGIDKGFVEPTKAVYEQLGNAWYAAQELDEAIDALTKAAELSLDGKLDMQVAYILVDKENWRDAKRRLEQAIEKGGISDSETGNLYVLLGMAELNTGNPESARRAFQQGRRYPKSRSAASEWLNHLDEVAQRGSGGN